MLIIRIRFPILIHKLFVDQIMVIMRIRFPPMPLQNYKHLSTKTIFVLPPAPPLSRILRIECMLVNVDVNRLTFNIYASLGGNI